MYLYIKTLHIIFVVTWFAGLFYIVRLFIYNREAEDKPQQEKDILQGQFRIMIRRLWYGITWPSCILTLFLGSWMACLYGTLQPWLIYKLVLVVGLFAYHLSLQSIYAQQMRGVFRYTSRQLRVWNEVATLFLFAIVSLAVLKSLASLVSIMGSVVILAALLMLAIKLYVRIRERRNP